MPRVVVCGLYPKQILAYLNFKKDCELRKAAPSELKETPVLVKCAGSTYAFIVGFVDKVVRGKPAELWKKYSKTFKFGIDKATFDEYFAEAKQGVIIHFSEIKLLHPPLKGVPASQTFRYLIIPDRDWNLYPLTDEKVRKKLIELTLSIQKELKEKYRGRSSILKKIV